MIMCCGESFTEFCFWIDRIAKSNRLLDIPHGKCWQFYLATAYLNISLGFILVVLTISCIFTGFEYSFLYDLVNCANGAILTSSFCNIVVVLLLIVTLKQQQSGWACFTAFVFTVVVFLLNIFFLFDTLKMEFHWLSTKSRPIAGEDWPSHFAWIDGSIIAILSLLELTDLIIITYYLLLATDFFGWKSRQSSSISHNRFN